jgi:lipid-A-disaccharide synthase
VAGEPSADRYGSRLVERLRELPGNQSLQFFGTGGDRMEKSGVEILRHARDLASIGPHEAIPVLRRYFETYRSLVRAATQRKPRVALLLDFPDFNLRLAKKLKRLGIKVIYYIGPQLWAWRSHRIRLVRRYVDKMLVILPFEEEYYRSRGVSVEYVGHPLLEDFAPEADRRRLLERAGIDADQKIVAVLPGSRRREVHYILPTLLKAAQLVLRRTPAQFLISAGTAIDRSDVQRLTTKSLAGDVNASCFHVISEDSRNLLVNSDFAMVKSGTSTLEAALIGVPFLIVYKLSPISWHLGWPLIKSRFVGLANLIANEEVVPEFLQEAANPAALAQKTLEYLESPEKCERMKLQLSAIREKLGKFCASERAAAIVNSLIMDGGI